MRKKIATIMAAERVYKREAAFCFGQKTSVKRYECMDQIIVGRLSAEVQTRRVAEEDLSDHALIEATKQGDESAYAEIVQRYRNPIVNYLYRFLNDYEEAIDLAQETFVRVYFAIDRYHTGYAFSTYIYRIATNLAISELRRRKRRRLLSLTGLFQSEADDITEFQPKDERQLQDDDLVEDEQNRVIARAIAALPEKYRVPIILRDVEGRSYEEIAEIMELGLGTTKSRISRGRGLLKEKLKGYL
jgi:RNA polymerase sigma-70 factor (ECF subfamily)